MAVTGERAWACDELAMMQLRTLQTIDGLGASASNTVMIALPVELMDACAKLDRSASIGRTSVAEQEPRA